MQLTKVFSTELDKLKRRIVKFARFSNSDVQTAYECLPFGIDSNCPAGYIALYSDTSKRGETVVVGYLNKNQMAASGEVRFYSVDASGNQIFYTWIKNDGTYELGGNAHNAVRYSPLNTGIQNFKTEIQTELAKIATAIGGVGGSYVPGTLSVDISNSKIDEIKTL